MIEEIRKEELKAAMDLVNQVFDEFVAVDYGEEGRKTFCDYMRHKYEELVTELETGAKRFWGYFEEGRVLGVMAVRMEETHLTHPHIALLFVHKDFHRKGIARMLFETAERAYQDYPVMTVNSSPYAVEVYRRLGFQVTAEEQDNNGIRYVPMRRAACRQ